MSRTRFNANERLRRLLSIIPWVAAHESVAIDEVATRFAYPRDELLSDLRDVVHFVGVYPFTPDTLVEVTISDDCVSIDYADYFSRPMRLSQDEALGLMAAGKSVLAVAGSDDGPLLRALTKLGAAMGSHGDAALDIRLGDPPTDVLRVLQEATAGHHTVEIDYYSAGADRRAIRIVEPHRVVSRAGRWYLFGYCRSAEDDRIFRLDRILSATGLPDEPVEADDAASEVELAHDDAAPRLTLALGADDEWVIAAYPHDEVIEHAGSLTVRLPVLSEGFCERLLLRLSETAEIVEADPGIDVDAASRAAHRILARYE